MLAALLGASRSCWRQEVSGWRKGSRQWRVALLSALHPGSTRIFVFLYAAHMAVLQCFVMLSAGSCLSSFHLALSLADMCTGEGVQVRLSELIASSLTTNIPMLSWRSDTYLGGKARSTSSPPTKCRAGSIRSTLDCRLLIRTSCFHQKIATLCQPLTQT